MKTIENLDIRLDKEKHVAGNNVIYISTLPVEIQNHSFQLFTTMLSIKGKDNSSIGAYFYAYRKLINWLYATKQREVIIDKMIINEVATTLEWKFALVRYRDYLVSNYAEQTILSEISMLNALLKDLFPRGLMPKFEGAPVEVPKELAKPKGDKDSKKDKKHYIVKHLSRTLAGLSFVKDTEINSIVKLFNDVEEKVAPTVTEREQVIALVVKSISDEHERLKTKAESIFEEALALLKEGEALTLCPFMATTIYDMSDTHKSILKRKNGRPDEFSASRLIETDFKEEFAEEHYLNALASFVHYYAEGSWPSSKTPIGGALASRIWPILGSANLRDRLHPSATMIGAATTLIVLQTALNGDSVRTLKVECLDIDTRGRARGLYYYKKRSDKQEDGQEDIKQLSNNRKLFKYPVETIVREYRRVSEKYRNQTASDHLWISVPRMAVGSEFIGELGLPPEPYSRSAISRKVKKLLKDQSVNSSANGLDDLRRQVLLLKALKSSAFAASVAADHKTSGTIKHYLDSDIMTLAINGKLSKFQSAFEFAIAQDVDLFCERVGIKKQEKDILLKNMTQSGLGTLCLDKRYNPLTKELSSDDGTCTSFESCMGCEKFKPIVLLEVENIARLIAFHLHLIKSEATCVIDNPINWNTKWYPWLLFTTSVMQFLDTPVHRKITKDAKAFLVKTPITLPILW
jgi:hypothetical protein